VNELSLVSRGCAAPRRRRARRIAATAAMVRAVTAFALSGRPVDGTAASSRLRAVPLMTLRSIDPCFYATAVPGSGSWPLRPLGAAHSIRGSFNEPRGSWPHFGVDVPALRNRAAVYSMAPGHILGWSRRGAHFSSGAFPRYYSYWHVNLFAGLEYGSWVSRGQLIGYVQPGYYHVHVSEFEGRCGWVDPRRPTGALHDPANRERPRIGPITAYVASPSAFAAGNANRPPATQHDRAKPLALDDLHGVVDLRASVMDMPTDRMRHLLQLPLEVAAIRAYMAPAGDPLHLVGRLHRIYDGARLLHPADGLWHVWAFGTYRMNGCYYNSRALCGADYVWHVGGPYGWDVGQLANGRYQYCVQAISVNGQRARRCAAVVVPNPPAA
jgi:hypothetical protein